MTTKLCTATLSAENTITVSTHGQDDVDFYVANGDTMQSAIRGFFGSFGLLAFGFVDHGPFIDFSVTDEIG